MSSYNNIKDSGGFTLLEVMIAMVIFSIGLLGLAGIQGVSLQNNYSAYTRTVGMQLAYNMSDVMRASTDIEGNINAAYNSVGVSVSTSAASCVQTPTYAGLCTDTELSGFEIYHWKKRIAETLPSGLGTISKSGDVYTITILWDELRTGTTGTTCADLKCYTLDIQT